MDEKEAYIKEQLEKALTAMQEVYKYTSFKSEEEVFISRAMYNIKELLKK